MQEVGLAQIWSLVPQEKCVQQVLTFSTLSDSNSVLSTMTLPYSVKSDALRTYRQGCEAFALTGQPSEGLIGMTMHGGNVQMTLTMDQQSVLEFPLTHFARQGEARGSCACAFRVPEVEPSLEFIVECVLTPVEATEDSLRAVARTVASTCSSIGAVDKFGGSPQVGNLVSFTSKPGSSVRQSRGKKDIPIEELQKYFSMSLKEASAALGIASTTLKRVCRDNGIARWPARKLAKVQNSLSQVCLSLSDVFPLHFRTPAEMLLCLSCMKRRAWRARAPWRMV